jgi:hypothetical protein
VRGKQGSRGGWMSGVRWCMWVCVGRVWGGGGVNRQCAYSYSPHCLLPIPRCAVRAAAAAVPVVPAARRRRARASDESRSGGGGAPASTSTVCHVPPPPPTPTPHAAARCSLLALASRVPCRACPVSSVYRLPRHAPLRHAPRATDPVRANQTRLPALGLLPLEFC